MATVRIQKNILEEKVDVLSIEEEVTIEEIIRKHTNESVYEGTPSRSLCHRNTHLTSIFPPQMGSLHIAHS